MYKTLINTLYTDINLSYKKRESLLINEKLSFVSFVFHTLKFT